MIRTNLQLVIHSGTSQPFTQSPQTATIAFDELKQWVRSGTILKRLFHYREVQFLVHRIELVRRPLLTALLLRLLVHGGCYIVDEHGQRQDIMLNYLVDQLRQFAGDWRRKGALLSAVEREIGYLAHAYATPYPSPPLDLSARPVYLRTDLVFGLRSGGSVGHIAGVLNHLDEFVGKPVFITSDRIPTVRPDIETHQILPRQAFWDFPELPSLAYNETFFQGAHDSIGPRPISFIYQRYSRNNYTGLKLARHYKVPFVLEYNGSEVWISRHWGKGLKYECLTEQIELLNLKAADVVVVVSRPMKDELLARGIDAAKILVNPNGVDPERYSPAVDGSDVRRKYGLNGKTVIGFIGTFGPWHGAEVLAEAFGRLLQESPKYREQVRLLMIGDGGKMAQVQRALANYEAMDACVLTGLVPQEEGPKHLAACDILVSPHVPNADGTPFFGSPTKLFEYMAMGKGIVASDLDQIGEVLEHDHTAWLVKPGDPQALVHGIKVLVDDEQLRHKLGQAARREVMAKYTWREHTKWIIEKLKGCCQ